MEVYVGGLVKPEEVARVMQLVREFPSSPWESYFGYRCAPWTMGDYRWWG